jgi:hypothetical protein
MFHRTLSLFYCGMSEASCVWSFNGKYQTGNPLKVAAMTLPVWVIAVIDKKS